MKYAPKKVFILHNGQYKELSYEEFCLLNENNSLYADKFFIALHGMLMEVTQKDYTDFYKSKRRQKYIDECSVENGVFSYDMLTTDDFNGEDILVDDSEPLDDQVIRAVMADKLRDALFLLTEDEQRLIEQHFFEQISQVELSRIYEVNQSTISRRIEKILQKLKNILKT